MVQEKLLNVITLRVQDSYPSLTEVSDAEPDPYWFEQLDYLAEYPKDGIFLKVGDDEWFIYRGFWDEDVDELDRLFISLSIKGEESPLLCSLALPECDKESKAGYGYAAAMAAHATAAVAQGKPKTTEKQAKLYVDQLARIAPCVIVVPYQEEHAKWDAAWNVAVWLASAELHRPTQSR